MTNCIDKKPKIVIANWKMNPERFIEAEIILKTIKKELRKSNNVKIIICPPSIYISKIKHSSSFEIGIQNIFWKNKGAYTGEISAQMAKNFGVGYAIIGHSERRRYLKENDEMINLKIKSALENGLKAIVCVGETLEEKKSDKTGNVIINQVEKCLKDIPKYKAFPSNLLIAYEPVWAIGTEKTPSVDEIMSVNLLIRKIISKLYDTASAENVFVLYGGGVNRKNAIGFVKETGMNGLLIGGASLNGSEFVKIVKSLM